MNLARSTYYYQLKNRRKVLEKEKEDADIKDLIDDIHTVFPYYGYRLLHEELKRRGHNVNTKRIRRLQSKFGLFPVRLRKFVKTTDSKHSLRVYPNLLKESPLPCEINKVFRYNLCEDINRLCVCSYYYGFVFKESDRLGCFSEYRQKAYIGSFKNGSPEKETRAWMYSSFRQRGTVCL